ncbi:MAG: energy transducer TonB [Planctomycetes bacterium]|nr:energy transducer TonB [Planctomycetota bacterium]HPF13106.1 energy transducer TonB [Planctomycetota bacterium]
MGLSSGVHAFALVLLPALLGLGWLHWKVGGTSSPVRDVRVTWNREAPPVDPLTDPPLPEDSTSEPIQAPDLPELESPPIWEPTPVAELDLAPVPEPIEAPWTVGDAADWAASMAHVKRPVPDALNPQPLFEVDPIRPEEVPTPAVPDMPVGEPIEVTWEPLPWDAFCPEPTYPRLAEMRRWEGTALVRLHIGADGFVEQVTLVESSGYDVLDREALRALGRWRFHPGPAGVKGRDIFRRVQFRLP